MAYNNKQKKPATPFSVELTDYKKDELIVLSTQNLAGNHWAVIRPNIKDNAYGYKKDTASIPLICGTGLVKDGNHWLLFTTDPSTELFEFDHKVKSGDWTSDEAKVDEYYENWKETGCLVALLCNGYKQLEVLCQNTQGKLFSYSEPELEVSFKNNDIDSEASKLAIEWSEENGQPTKQDFKNKELDFLSVAEEQNTFPVILLSEDDIEEFCSITIGSGRRAEKTQLLLPCEFTDETLPSFSNLKFESPKLYESQGGGKRGGYGTTVNVESETAKDRLTFILENLNTNNLDDLIVNCNDDDYRLKVNLLLSISGATFPLNMGEVTVRERNERRALRVTSNAITPVNVETQNGKNEISTDEFLDIINETDVVEDPLTDETEAMDDITPEEPTMSSNASRDALAKWITTKNTSGILPKDFDLVDKDDAWCSLVLTVLEGNIAGQPVATRGGYTKLKAKNGRKALSDYELEDLEKALTLLDS